MLLPTFPRSGVTNLILPKVFETHLMCPIGQSALLVHYYGRGLLCDPLCHHLTPGSSRSKYDGPVERVRQISMIKVGLSAMT